MASEQPRLLTYRELAEAYEITERQVSNIINVLDFNGKEFEKYENIHGRTMVAQHEFEPAVTEWKTSRRRGVKKTVTENSESDFIPIGKVMKDCGIAGNDHGRYFAGWARDQSRKPMSLTKQEAEEMKAHYLAKASQSQISINETPEQPAKSLTIDEIMEALTLLLIRA